MKDLRNLPTKLREFARLYDDKDAAEYADALDADLAALQSENARLRAELERVKVDAARYRWLRDHRDADGDIDEEFHVAVDGQRFKGKWALTGDDLDAAIDSAAGGGG